jgi:hypothetical protein
LSVQAVDAAANRGSPAVAIVTVSDRHPAALPELKSSPDRRHTHTPLPQLAGAEVAIIDELDKVHPESGQMIPAQPDDYLTRNHLWDAAGAKITLQAARNEFAAFQVLVRGKIPLGSIKPELVFDERAAQAITVDAGRYQSVATKLGPLPDPIVPLSDPVPGGSRDVKYQSLHVEIYIPHNLPAGDYRGILTLRSAGRRDALHLGEGKLNLPLALRVWDFTLPDHLSFLPEMNCYGLPENERDYYRLAHRHRAVLNRLPYSQRGQIADGCAPRWDPRRQNLDWSLWDRRFGPLLDGSAFADLPRKSVPVDVFYLPLHENWPSPMQGNYNGDYWADRAFPDTYRQAFVSAARQFAAHIQAKKWGDTLFHGFLNNKVDFKRNGWSRGSSPWLLDEPASFQDYWALRYFALAFHEGVNQAWAAGAQPSAATPRLVFRVDDSRPEWRRDCLDGLVDYHVVGSAMRTYPRLVSERKRILGEIVLEYGSTNAVEDSNVQPVGWCLDVWALGADGVIPWQTVGTAESWARADELSLLYPSRNRSGRSASTAIAPPIPSIRLKAYRRGQQDVEYLVLWSRLRNEPQWAVGRQVREALKLAGTRQETDVASGEDAGRIDYGRLRPRDLWELRVAIGEALSQAHPPFQAKLVDFRTPRRDAKNLPPAYVGEAGQPERNGGR